ncbi:MAG: hypothetical protein QW165_04315 [Candidatus Woesearchaeota archaeon]
MPKDHKTIEAVMLIIVLLTAAIGLYYMYSVSTGRAFIQAPTIAVRQTTLEFCCCAPIARPDHPFTVYGKILKDATIEEKVISCNKICEEHSTQKNPVNLVKVGKCGSI